MANTLITSDIITKETARLLVNNLKFAGNVNRSYDDQFSSEGAKVGYTVKARLPQRFRTTKGQALQVQAITDQYVPVTVTDQANVGFSFSSASLTMEVDEYRARYIKPASEQLANTIDYDGLSRVYPDVYQSVGVPGVTISTNITYLTAGAILSNAGTPVDGRLAILDPLSTATISNANVSVFNPQRTISENFKSGQFAGPALGFDSWYMDQNVARHTTGTFTASTPVASSANQTGSSLATSGWASGAASLKRGDVFTVAGVFAVNPQNYQSTGALQQFVVTSDIDNVATTVNMTIPIAPAIITSGPFQTVTASPANNAAVTVLGATSATAGTLATLVSSQGLLYHRDAFTMVMADLAMPQGGADASRVSNNQLGIALRFVKQYNIQTDQNAARLDCLYGWKTIRPELAARGWGA